MEIIKQKRRQVSLLLVFALLAGGLPMGKEKISQAAQQNIQGARIIQSVQEIPAQSGKKTELKNPTVSSDGVTTWDCIWFGNYWQEDTNGDGKADKNDQKTPIKWRVLSVEGDDVFLLADKSLDCQKYNESSVDVTWETCTLRSWLNGYGKETNVCGKDYSTENFMDHAFTPEEQSAVKTTDVINKNNPEYGIEGGKNTTDKVYLLSIDEVTDTTYGFDSVYENKSTSRRSVQTAYTNKTQSLDSEVYWLLRSPGSVPYCVSQVYYNGSIQMFGEKVDTSYRSVRPALHLNLSSASGWSYAGTVGSDNGVSTWDCIWFGNYWQEDTNGDGKADENDDQTPIKWRVLSVEGDDAFLLADKGLDCQSYNESKEDVTWETCTLRSWLNGYGADKNIVKKDYSGGGFLNNAFTPTEQQAIMTTNVVNEDNPEYGTEGGNDTSDKVYLLSRDAAMNSAYGFSTLKRQYAENRRGFNTTFAKDKGAETSESVEHSGIGTWLLRSIGYSSKSAFFVHIYGYLDAFDVSYDSYAVRPVLHLNLSSYSSWTYAGTVASDGVVKEIKPSTPSPTEPDETQPPQETELPSSTTPAKTAGPVITEKPAVTQPATPSPTEPGVTQPPQETELPSSTTPAKTAGPVITEKPAVTQPATPSPTEPGVTQPPQETELPSSTTPAKTAGPVITEKPAVTQPATPSPTEPGVTQPPQETTAPGTPSQPGTSSVVPFAPQPGFSVTPESDSSYNLGKATVGKVSSLKLKQKKGTVTASWKKTAGVKGYQICYSTSKKWKGKKQKLVSKNKAVIKKLKKKKTYYFRVRAYRLEGTKKVYGAWSSVKRIKIRK